MYKYIRCLKYFWESVPQLAFEVSFWHNFGNFGDLNISGKSLTEQIENYFLSSLQLRHWF